MDTILQFLTGVLRYVLPVLALLILRLYEKHAGRQALLELTIDTGARQVRCFALADSGNRLREPFSGAPVIVARRSLFPDTETPRVIPYQTVGGEGMLTAFRPHRVTVHSGKRRGTVGEVYVALSEHIQNEDYQAVVDPKIFSWE